MKIEFLRPFLKYIPEVKRPSRALPLKDKVLWVALALGIFYVLGVIYPFGVTEAEINKSGFELMQMVFASHIGSLLTVGIGPIVVGSIMLQLLVGTGALELDLTRNEDKALFQGAQKILVVIFSLLEAAAMSMAFQLGGGMYWLVVLQIAMGSIILMFLDEIVSKYGIGSGIGLFIAGGVSQSIITASINPMQMAGTYVGAIPNFIALLDKGNFDIVQLFPIVATIIVFLVVVYGESMRLEIPLAYGTIRGISARYPIKFFYVSNIPVILAAALIQSLQLIPSIFGIHAGMSYPEMNMLQQGVYTFFSYITPGYGGANNIYGVLNPSSIYKLGDIPVIVHILIYGAVFLGLCVLFGKFWAATTNIGPEKVAQQIHQGGMQIPGFRRDIRVIQHVLERYIPQMVVISSIAVGLLALSADLLGVFGSGTGILLTVGILFRMYEQLQKEEMGSMPMWFRGLFGKHR
ncbi:MAG: preprotein translocase subunit SecY [Candidatus Altiarchaeales archaeon HGW-Altiarchaeales-1]|nr:MAG: preprotein translocase subunit SecY [Candidatus Altiarchaeales archaeon HGW-Altiarchaeales-1]